MSTSDGKSPAVAFLIPVISIVAMVVQVCGRHPSVDAHRANDARGSGRDVPGTGASKTVDYSKHLEQNSPVTESLSSVKELHT